MQIHNRVSLIVIKVLYKVKCQCSNVKDIPLKMTSFIRHYQAELRTRVGRPQTS